MWRKLHWWRFRENEERSENDLNQRWNFEQSLRFNLRKRWRWRIRKNSISNCIRWICIIRCCFSSCCFIICCCIFSSCCIYSSCCILLSAYTHNTNVFTNISLSSISSIFTIPHTAFTVHTLAFTFQPFWANEHKHTRQHSNTAQTKQSFDIPAISISRRRFQVTFVSLKLHNIYSTPIILPWIWSFHYELFYLQLVGNNYFALKVSRVRVHCL